MKLLFKPVGMLGGLAAGLLAKKLFEVLWSAIDDEEPPQAEHRQASLAKLTSALALEGAIFSVARGLFDHGARRVFEGLSGAWPGQEAPEKDDEDEAAGA